MSDFYESLRMRPQAFYAGIDESSKVRLIIAKNRINSLILRCIRFERRLAISRSGGHNYNRYPGVSARVDRLGNDTRNRVSIRIDTSIVRYRQYR